MTYLGMNSLDEMPSTEFLSQDIWMSDDKERRELLTKISTDIVNNFVDLSPSFSSTFQKDEGTAYDYACEVLSLGLFSFDFKDAVREGDGDHIFKHWKYLLLLFKASLSTGEDRVVLAVGELERVPALTVTSPMRCSLIIPDHERRALFLLSSYQFGNL